MTGQLQLLWFSNLENMAMHVSFFLSRLNNFYKQEGILGSV